MLTQLKTLFRRVDFYLRNETYRPPTGQITLRPIDDLFDKEEGADPLRTRVYWGIRRFWNHHWLCNPRDIYYAIKYAYQRVARGWDDRAVWSIDWWLDDKMPAMLRKLKEDKHGIPGDMFEGLPTKEGEPWNHTDEAYAMAEERWNAILDKMIAAFEASRRIQELTYEDELGDYPLYRPAGVTKEDWAKVKHDRFLASELLRERDQKIFKEGMALFAEHYWSLWD